MSLARAGSILAKEATPWADEIGASVGEITPLQARTSSKVSPQPWWQKVVGRALVFALGIWFVAALVNKRGVIFKSINVAQAYEACTQKCDVTRDGCFKGIDQHYLAKATKNNVHAGELVLFRQASSFDYSEDIKRRVVAKMADEPGADSEWASVRFAGLTANSKIMLQDLFVGVVPCETNATITSFSNFKACQVSRRDFDKCSGDHKVCTDACGDEKLVSHGNNTVKYTFIMLGSMVVGLLWSVISEMTGASAALSAALARLSPPPSARHFGLPCLAALGLAAALAARLVEAHGNIRTLQPLIGAVLVPGMWYGMSDNRSSVEWRIVLGGFALQIFVVLSMQIGACKEFAQTMGDMVTGFLNFSLQGSHAVFGAQLVEIAPFCFQVMPCVIFFSAVVSVAYYGGVLQVCILGVAKVLRVLIGASTTEAVSSSGNIFLGLTEIPLLMRPLLPSASKSELHVIMTCSYASVAGSVLAAYIGLGVKADYLVLSCLMSAPAGIAMSKLACPSDVGGESPATDEAAPAQAAAAAEGASQEDIDQKTMEALKSEDGSLIEAAGNGASNAIALVANIVAMLIAFVSIITAANFLAQWFFACLGFENLTISTMFGVLLAPVAFTLGVPPSECRAVGLLLANKLVLNEFVAYSDLGKLVKNSQGGKVEELMGYSITTISAQSELTATFAICGFANLGSVGIQLGSLSTVCPEKRRHFAAMVMRTMLVGYSVSLMNSCMATMLVKPS